MIQQHSYPLKSHGESIKVKKRFSKNDRLRFLKHKVLLLTLILSSLSLCSPIFSSSEITEELFIIKATEQFHDIYSGYPVYPWQYVRIARKCGFQVLFPTIYSEWPRLKVAINKWVPLIDNPGFELKEMWPIDIIGHDNIKYESQRTVEDKVEGNYSLKLTCRSSSREFSLLYTCKYTSINVTIYDQVRWDFYVKPLIIDDKTGQMDSYVVLKVSFFNKNCEYSIFIILLGDQLDTSAFKNSTHMKFLLWNNATIGIWNHYSINIMPIFRAWLSDKIINNLMLRPIHLIGVASRNNATISILLDHVQIYRLNSWEAFYKRWLMFNSTNFLIFPSEEIKYTPINFDIIFRLSRNTILIYTQFHETMVDIGLTPLGDYKLY